MTRYLNEEMIEEIKTQNNIIDIISKYVPLKKSGRNYKGLCPFHHEKTASFMVSEEKQFFHCFGCGAAGDVISFIMKIENLDFVQASTLLGERVGIYLDNFLTNKQEKEEISRKNKIYEINREAALFYYNHLWNGKNNGLNYLYNRGLKDHIIKKFGLGYALRDWEDLNQYLLNKGYDQELIYAAGLVIGKKKKDGYYDRFRNRVIFPIFNVIGKVIGFGGRAIEDIMPKYLNSPETPIFNKGNNLYGLNFAKNQIRSKKQCIVVEGYMDVISLYQRGIKNVTASLGTALTEKQADLLKRYAEEIIIAYDADAAGQTATLRGMDLLKEVGCHVKVLRLSQGKDPDEFIKKRGKEAFSNEINQALSLIDKKILLAKQANDLKTVEGRINFVKSITEVLKQLKSPIEVDAYIKKIAEESQISIEAIKYEVYGNTRYNYDTAKRKMTFTRDQYRSKPYRYTNQYTIKPVKPVIKLGHLEAERCLLKLALLGKNSFKKIKACLSYNDFTDISNQKIAKIIDLLYETNDSIDEKSILNQLDTEDHAVLEKINECIIPEEYVEKALIDYIHCIEEHQLSTKKMEIEKELKELEKEKNKSDEQIVRIRELCISYEKVLKKLKK